MTMTYFKKDKLFEAINNLSQADKVKLHNLFYGNDHESKIWRMDQINEYFDGCTPRDIVDCIQTAGGNFETDDDYFYEDDYCGLVSIQGRQIDRFECSPFVSQYEYIDQLEQLEKPTGISAIDEIMALPDFDESELRDEFNKIIEKAIARKLKEIYRSQGENVRKLDVFNTDVNEAIMELSETVVNDFFENWQ